jgi:pimeloyl-ACP methyl ester carboxylesterase
MAHITHRFIETNGIRMHIAEQGTGPLVLLLHGFPELWYSWRHQLAALADAGYHAVAPDLRGYGQTDQPAASECYTQLHLVGDVIGLIDALSEETAVVAGHDWGALLTWNTALLRPGRVRAAIALDIPYSPRARSSLLAAARSTLGDGFYINYFQKPGVAEAEFERDTRVTLRKLLYAASGDAPQGRQLALVIPEGQGMLDHAIDPEVLPAWLTEADITYYTTAFERTGFTGGLNWYRMIDKSWELMAAWHEAHVVPPALFIAGDRGPGANLPNRQQRLATMQQFVPNLKATMLLPGAGHWIQEERSIMVSEAMIEFLQNL